VEGDDPLARLMYRLRYALINARDRRARRFYARVTIAPRDGPCRDCAPPFSSHPRPTCRGTERTCAHARARKHNQGRAEQKH